jgi:hypothetical protein
MSSIFERFKRQLDDAVDLIEDRNLIEFKGTNASNLLSNLLDTESLLHRCESVCKNHQTDKPTLRIIQHLACSGGTLISKCISVMPNVYVLSEAHPFTNRGTSSGNATFAPTDISTLLRYSNFPELEETLGEIFQSSIRIVLERSAKIGATFVIRYHNHSDYHSGIVMSSKKILTETLGEYFNIVYLTTIRDPIDSFSSLKKNNWVHFSPASFEEYCRRYLIFLNEINKDNIIRYEDFVLNPSDVMLNICDLLSIDYNPDFELVYDIAKLTGDSGRQSSDISKRERNVADSILEEAAVSKSYKTICAQYGY